MQLILLRSIAMAERERYHPGMDRRRRTGYRVKCSFSKYFARLVAAFITLFIVLTASASTRPHYGSTAHILIQHRINSLDPLVETEYQGDRDKISRLVFETLTQIDAQGRVQPHLINSWQSEAALRVWQFQLRLANFPDGTAVTSTVVVASLKTMSPEWKFTIYSRQTFTIETPTPSPHLPELLSLPKFAIVKRLSDTTLVGTGPYKVSQWQPGEHALFAANDDYWGGRPYPDAIEIQMNAALRDQLLQRQLGPYAAAEVNLDALRVLDTTTQNLLISRPSDLLVIMFLQPDSAVAGARGAKKAIDPRIREALSASLNRPAVSALLQRRAQAASGLLPQWLTGYEFLMDSAQDTDRARRLAATAGGITTPVTLAYDFSDPTAKLVAERIQVDAGQAGIQVKPYGESHLNSRTARATMNADAVLLRVPLPAVEPGVALAALSATLGLDAQTASSVLAAGRPEDLLFAERKALEGFHVIPVARLPQAVWINGSAHNWLQSPTGAWDLQQLWMEGAR